MRTKRTAALFGVWMALLGLGFWIEPGAQQAIRPVAGISAVLAVLAGIRANRPAYVVPWRLLMAAVVASAAGTASYLTTAGRPVGTVLMLIVYPMLATALLIFVRRRTGGGRDRGGLLDALTLSAGIVLLAWVGVIGPHVRTVDLGAPEQWLSVAFPAGDLLCLCVLFRLLITTGRRLTAAGLLGVGIIALLVADIGYNLVELRGDLEFLGAFGRIPLYGAIGLAALHPSMVTLTEPVSAPVTEFGRLRLLLLTFASLLAPTVLVVQFRVDGEVADLPIIAGLSALTFALVLARLAGIMATHRLAMARERGLRQASTALVSAADEDQVAEAVRRTVAQLLPPDLPHRVVLAMAVNQPDQPVTAEVAAQAAADRAAGTTATVLGVRELEWAVAVRLSQFHTALRCPLVLPDRPAGDPLLGLLVVGGPAWALLGLRSSLEVLAGQAALALERIELNAEVTRRNSEAYFRTLVLNTSDVILVVDDHDRVRYASPAAAGVLGHDPIAETVYEAIHPVDRRRFADVLALLRSGDDAPQGLDFRGPDRLGTEVTLELHCRDLRADQTVAGLVVTFRDVSERRRLERELTHQAFHDSLTGLANRVLFTDRLEHALARGARDGSVVGVLFIDLDDFKIVNDTLGHAAGDQLLTGVADRIAGALRADDTAARLGGDEFAALVENVQDPGAVEETARRILAALEEPIPVDGDQLTVAASIGITTTPEAHTAAELLRQADLALYVAKGAGKRQWRRYQAHLHGVMVERLELRSALEHSVSEGRFVLQFQPIVDLAGDEPVGFEALVRWDHPVRGIIAPDQFIEVAEESGLIVPMGRWVLDQALHTVAQWRRILPRTRQPYVSVNVSVRQLREPGFVAQVAASLEHAGVPPRALMLEITETLLMGDAEPIWADLAHLQETGVRIAVDDFGTGYSSLGYLRQLPMDVLKIDKTFIDDMLSDDQQLALVAGIINLARTLNLTVVAEGIETAAQQEMLVRLGCPLGQGFLFSPPVGATEALACLHPAEPLAA